MGNRTSKTDSGGGINGTEGYTYNNANMLLTRGANSYTNDANGNTLTGGGRTNTWDNENRLITCAYGSNTTINVYGSDGIRHRSIVNGVTTDSVLDSSMMIREMRAGSAYATYLNGPRGPEYRRDNGTPTTAVVRWYVYDGLGSVVAEVDPSGNATSSRKYDAYGLVRSGVNPRGTSKQKFVGSLGHTSDDESGLVYMRARYMDPDNGRFASEDPARDGTNWYIYVTNSSVNKVDRDGKVGELVEVEGATSIGEILEGISSRFMVYLSDIQKISNVTSDKAIQALINMSQDPSKWRWVVASIGGFSGSDGNSGFAMQGWLKAIVCIEGRSMGAYLEMELETHPIPYGQLTSMTGT